MTTYPITKVPEGRSFYPFATLGREKVEVEELPESVFRFHNGETWKVVLTLMFKGKAPKIVCMDSEKEITATSLVFAMWPGDTRSFRFIN